MGLERLRESEIFDGKTLEDVFRDIYDRSTEDRDEAMIAFREFKHMVSDKEDLFLLGDKPSQYLKIAQESTDNLIKMVAAVQKLMAADETKTESVNKNDILDILEGEGIAPKRFAKVAKEAIETKESEKEKDEEMRAIQATKETEEIFEKRKKIA